MKRLILFLFAFVILMTMVSSTSITTFNNSLTTQPLSYTSNVNVTRYLNVPQNFTITNAFMNLTNNSGGIQDYSIILDYQTIGTETVEGITVANDKLYILDSLSTATNSAVYEYYMNGSATGFSFNVYAETAANPKGLTYNNNTNTFYVLADSSNPNVKIYEYNITGSYTGSSFAVGAIANRKTDIFFSNNTIYVSDTNPSALEGWTTAGVPTYNITFTGGPSINIAFATTLYNNKTYVGSGANRTIYEFNNDGSYNNFFQLANTSWTSLRALTLYNDTFYSGGVLSSNGVVNRLYTSEGSVSNVSVYLGSTRIFNSAGTFNQSNNRTTNFKSTVASYLSSCSIVSGICQIPFTFHSDSPGILIYSGLTFNNDGFIENSQSYSNVTNEGKIENFSINITYDNNTFSPSAIFNYNGTNYTSTLSGTGNTILFSRSITIPNINATQINNTFYWVIILTPSNGSSAYFNSTSYNQTVNNLFMDNCSTFTDNILNSFLFDEDARSVLNGTIETLVNIYDSNFGNLVTSFNNTVNSTSSRVCFKSGVLNTTTYTMSYEIKYYATSYSVEYVNSQNVSVTNATIPYNISLYDLITANEQDCQITYRDRYLIPQDNVVLNLQRQYIPINSYLQVEAPVTDVNGQVILHFARNNPIYNIIAIQNGEILSTQSNVQLSNVGTTSCVIPLNEINSNQNLVSYNDQFNLMGTFTNTNTTLNFIFSTLDGTPEEVSWNVIVNSGYGNQTICTNTQLTASGTLSCTVPTLYLNSSVIASVFVNGERYTTKGFSFGPKSAEIFGGVRVLLMMMMFVTIALLFISSPIGIVLGSIFGMIFGGLLLAVDGLNILNLGSIVFWFVIAGSIIIWRLSKTVG